MAHSILRERCQAIAGQGSKRHQCKRPAATDGRFCTQHEREINGGPESG